MNKIKTAREEFLASEGVLEGFINNYNNLKDKLSYASVSSNNIMSKAEKLLSDLEKTKTETWIDASELSGESNEFISELAELQKSLDHFARFMKNYLKTPEY